MCELTRSTKSKCKLSVSDTRIPRSLVVYGSRAIVPRSVFGLRPVRAVAYILNNLFKYTIVSNNQSDDERIAQIILELLERNDA